MERGNQTKLRLEERDEENKEKIQSQALKEWNREWRKTGKRLDDVK